MGLTQNRFTRIGRMSADSSEVRAGCPGHSPGHPQSTGSIFYFFGVGEACGVAEDPDPAGQVPVPFPILLTLMDVWLLMSPMTATDSPMCDESTETFAFEGKFNL